MPRRPWSPGTSRAARTPTPRQWPTTCWPTGRDVVALQEVQWHQARRIARALGARSHRWASSTGRSTPGPRAWRSSGSRATVTAHATRAVVRLAAVELAPPHRAGGPDRAPRAPDWTLVNVHLTPHGQIGLRAVETSDAAGARGRARRARGRRPATSTSAPAGPSTASSRRRGCGTGGRSGWRPRARATAPTGRPQRRPDPWPTNWRGWTRGTTEPPDAAARLRVRHRRCPHARRPHTAARRPGPLRVDLRPPAGHRRVRRGVTLSCPRPASATRAWV